MIFRYTQAIHASSTHHHQITIEGLGLKKVPGSQRNSELGTNSMYRRRTTTIPVWKFPEVN
jgi:hypothetical protein